MIRHIINIVIWQYDEYVLVLSAYAEKVRLCLCGKITGRQEAPRRLLRRTASSSSFFRLWVYSFLFKR
jgi:hypothetical protein